MYFVVCVINELMIMETDMKMIAKSFIAGMSSAFDVFPATQVKSYKIFSTNDQLDGFSEDAQSLRNDMKTISDDFNHAIKDLKL